MLSVDALKACGANTEEGLARCFNNETFYLKLVRMGLADANFDRLSAAVAAGDTAAAFEAAHALKGSIGNLSLTPIYEPVSQLTELLRGKTGSVDAGALHSEIMKQLEIFRALDR